MSVSGHVAPVSSSEFLVWEREQADKHEWIDGEVFAMAGGSVRHAAITSAFAGELHAALRGGPCRVLSSDQKVSARRGQHFVYPDATVLCGAAILEAGTTDVLANPSVIIEVLSKGIESYDRGLKWRSYQQIDTLLDYVLLSQSTPLIEHYQRAPDGSWRYRAVAAGEHVTLMNGAVIAVDAVYMGVFELDGESA